MAYWLDDFTERKVKLKERKQDYNVRNNSIFVGTQMLSEKPEEKLFTYPPTLYCCLHERLLCFQISINNQKSSKDSEKMQSPLGRERAL